MNSNITMTISGFTRTNENKAVYIMFTEQDKTAEIALPGCRVIANNGFTEEELKKLVKYVGEEQEAIYAEAKKVNPFTAMMK